MSRFPSPTTTHLNYPPKYPNGNLNFVSIKQKCLYLLNLCSSMRDLLQIHAQIQTSGLHQDSFVISETLRFCALSSTGSLDYARFLLRITLITIPASWNFVIRGYASSNFPRGALEVFVEMRRRGTRPNKVTFPFLFKACSQLSDLEGGRQIQAQVVKNGSDSDVYVKNTLIYLYGSCGQLLNARRVFDGMCVRTVVSWNSILSVYVENSQAADSVKLFAQMRSRGFKPDATTMVVLLSACAELGNMSLGKWVHCHVIEEGVAMNIQLATALVNMYAKCGAINCSRSIFHKMPQRNVWTWSAMILGLAQHGQAKEALEFFQLMKQEKVRPNYVTYLGVLCACSHAGLVDDGHHFFQDMINVHGIEPMMSHYSAMVDIFSRKGHLEDAYKFITSMPIEPDAVVWRTLLSACSVHDVSDSGGIGKKVRKRLLQQEPRRSGNYVMVANMYAEVGLWEEAATMRRVMRHEGLKKMAGESCIEVGGLVHSFVCGDDSGIDYEGVYCLLQRLNLQMKMVTHTHLDIDS